MLNMKTEVTTDSNSTNRIWIEVLIGSLHYSHNDREKWNSVKSTLDFFKSKEKEIKKHVNVRVEPSNDGGDYNNSPTHYINIIGYREETDEEYKKRLGYMHADMLRKKESAKLSHSYYSSKDFEKAEELIKKQIKSIKK